MLRGTFRHATICTAAAPAPNHGFTAYFDGRSCEDGAADRPRIEFFVGYNVPYEATGTFDLARHICGRRAIAASGMRVDGLKFLVCDEPDGHGFVAVNYVALRTPFPDQGDEPYGGTALIFTIHARCGELALYRERAYRLASELHLVPGRRD